MKIKKLTLGSLMMALAIILPQAFHLTGVPQSGMVFLPMHIPVLLTGFFLGPWYGLVIGVIAPVISFLLTNMPAADRLLFMIIELGVYGVVSGYLYHTIRLYQKKTGILISLIASMVVGRIVYAFTLFIASGILGLQAAGPLFAWTATVIGLYGIVIQVLIIPTIVFAMKRGGFLDGFFGSS